MGSAADLVSLRRQRLRRGYQTASPRTDRLFLLKSALLRLRLNFFRVQQARAQSVSDELIFVMTIAPVFFGARTVTVSLVLHDRAELAQVIGVLNSVG